MRIIEIEGMYRNLSATKFIVGIIFITGKSVTKKKTIEKEINEYFLKE
jgi:hypothetical protein